MKSVICLYLLLVFQDIPGIITEYNSVNRLILIFSKDNRSELYNQALLEITHDPIGLAKKDVLIFEVFNRGGIYPDGRPISENDAEILWEYFNLKEKEFTIILINKDSQEIFRSIEPIKADKIIRVFDNEKSDI